MIFKIEDENIAEKEIKEKKEKKEEELKARLPEAVESITIDSTSTGIKASITSSDTSHSDTLDIGSHITDGHITAGGWDYEPSGGAWVYGHGPSSISSTPHTSVLYGDWVYKPEGLTCHIETEPIYATAEEFSKKVVRVIREEAADEAACAARSRAREALEEATKKERKKYLVKKSEKEEAEDKKMLEALDVDGLVAAAVVRGAQLGAARVIQAVSGVIDLKPVSKDLDDIIDALSKVVREMNLNGKVKCAPGTGATAYWFDVDEKERKIKTK